MTLLFPEFTLSKNIKINFWGFYWISKENSQSGFSSNSNAIFGCQGLVCLLGQNISSKNRRAKNSFFPKKNKKNEFDQCPIQGTGRKPPEGRAVLHPFKGISFTVSSSPPGKERETAPLKSWKIPDSLYTSLPKTPAIKSSRCDQFY